MEPFLFAANMIFIATYLVNDLLRIRMLSIAGTVCLVVYFSSQAQPMPAVVAWNLVFLVMNGVQVGRLLAARRSSGPALQGG